MPNLIPPPPNTCHAQIQKVLSEGDQTLTTFLVDEGRKDKKIAFRLRAGGGPTLNASLVFQGIPTSIAKKPYIFVIFQGGGSGPPALPSGSAHAYSKA